MYEKCRHGAGYQIQAPNVVIGNLSPLSFPTPLFCCPPSLPLLLPPLPPPLPPFSSSSFSLSLSHMFSVLPSPSGMFPPNMWQNWLSYISGLDSISLPILLRGNGSFPPPPKAPTTLLDMNVLDWLLTKMRNRSHRQITDAYYLPIDRRPCNLLSKTWLDTKGVLWIIMPGQKCKQRLSWANGDTWSPWLQDIPVERLTSGWCSDERPGWGRGFGVVGKSCLDGRIRKKTTSLEWVEDWREVRKVGQNVNTLLLNYIGKSSRKGREERK